MDDTEEGAIGYQTVSIGDLAVVSPPKGALVSSSPLQGMIALVTDDYGRNATADVAGIDICEIQLSDGRTIYLPKGYLRPF